MDLGRIPLFALAFDKMAWLNRRQAVLADNIANADTPNFQPEDLKALDSRAALRSVGAQTSGLAPVLPVATDPKHFVGASGQTSGGFANEPQKKTYETTLSDNAVVLEEQMMKVAQTQADFEMATNLYKKYVAMVKLALGRNGA